MPCMCGDPYCGSCGPAQGNNRCPYCGAWDMDGGCEDPEKCEKAYKEEEAYWLSIEESEEDSEIDKL